MSRATELLKAIRIEAESIPTQFNTWLGKFPGTNAQQLASILAFLVTTLVVCWCMLQEIKLDPVTLAETYAFICAYGGIVYKQFKHKRDSYNPNLPQNKESSDAPST